MRKIIYTRTASSETFNRYSAFRGAGILTKGFIAVILGFVLLFLIAALFSGSDITEDEFGRMMAQEAIQDARPSSPRFGACGDKDYFQQAFAGVKNGVPVNGVLCKGISKGITIRYF